MSAPRNMVSAVPDTALERKPHIAALTVSIWSAVSLGPAASAMRSGVIFAMSSSSTHFRRSFRIGALEMKCRSSFPFHATPPLSPLNLYSSCVASFSSRSGRSLKAMAPS